MVDKVVRLEDAIAVIDDEDTICVAGFVGIGTRNASSVVWKTGF